MATQYLAQESVLKSDSLEVKAKLAQAQYQVVQLQDTLQTQKEQLNELLARDLDTPFRTEQVPAITPAEMDLKTAAKHRAAAAARSQRSGNRHPTRRIRPQAVEGQVHSRCRRSHSLSRPNQHRVSAAKYSFRRFGAEVGPLRLGRTQRRGQAKGCVTAAEPLSTAGNAGPGDARCRQLLPQARGEPLAAGSRPGRARRGQ